MRDFRCILKFYFLKHFIEKYSCKILAIIEIQFFMVAQDNPKSGKNTISSKVCNNYGSLEI